MKVFRKLLIFENVHLNGLIYATTVEIEDALLDELPAAFETTQNTPGLFERVPQCKARRCTACNEVGGYHFEKLL